MKTSSKIILIVGIVIIAIFGYISVINIFLQRDFSDMKFISGMDNNSARIENINFENGLLSIQTSNAKYICVKSTRSNPSINSVCWNKIDNNLYSTNIYSYKIYYIWLLDQENNISEKTIFNLKNNK